MVESGQPQVSQGEQKVAMYRINHEKQEWYACDAEGTEIDGFFTEHSIDGHSDWAYKHQRLTYPGFSKFKLKFKMPDALPPGQGNKYKLKTNNFAPWQMDDCTCSIKLNGEYLEKKFKVRGENHGRTTSEWQLNESILKFNGEENLIVLEFDDGAGVLFMNWFEFWADIA